MNDKEIYEYCYICDNTFLVDLDKAVLTKERLDNGFIEYALMCTCPRCGNRIKAYYTDFEKEKK